jgi:hypothetical protein
MELFLRPAAGEMLAVPESVSRHIESHDDLLFLLLLADGLAPAGKGYRRERTRRASRRFAGTRNARKCRRRDLVAAGVFSVVLGGSRLDAIKAAYGRTIPLERCRKSMPGRHKAIAGP